MNIQDVALLTVKEYNQYKSIIPVIEHSWWLQDNGESGCFCIVSWLDHEVFDGAYYSGVRYVRPVLRVTDVNYKPGEKAAIFAHSWTALDTIDGVTLLLCDAAVTLRRFDKVEAKYEGSEVQQWLRAWLAKRQKTTDNKKHKCYKRMNEIGMAYTSNPFWNTWFAPMVLLLPLSVIFFFYTQPLSELPTPEWILNTAKFIALSMYFVVLVTSAFSTLFVLGGPHKDTGFRHLLNTAALIVVLVLYYNALTLHAVTTLISVAALAAVNHRYLQAIKYYS